MAKDTKDNKEEKEVEELTEEFEEISTEERIISIEKKINWILVLVIVTLFFSLCSMIYVINGSSTTDATSDTTTTDESDYTYDTSELEEISASDIKSASKGKTIVAVIARQGCYYCSVYMPTLTSVAKDYDVTVKYIDFAKIVDFTQNPIVVSDQDAYDTIANLEGTGDWSEFGAEAVKGTPNTLFIKDNKIIYGINGAQEESTVKAAFDAAGLG